MGGENHVVKGVDGVWSYFEALDIVRNFKCIRNVKLWWKPKYKNLKLLNVDRDTIELSIYGEIWRTNQGEVEIYVEYIPNRFEIKFSELVVWVKRQEKRSRRKK